MDDRRSDALAVWRRYSAEHRPIDERPERLVEVQSSGLSGAELWKAETPSGMMLLRRWPAEHPSRERLAWMHRVLRHTAAQGYRLCPEPLPVETPAGDSAWRAATFVEQDGRLWELARWMSGCAWEVRPPDVRPSPEALAAGCKALAGFHRAAESFSPQVPPGPSPGLAERRKQLARWVHGDAARVLAAASRAEGTLKELTGQLLFWFEQRRASVDAELRDAASTVVPLAPALRDVRGEHVLFDRGRVSGLIDYGAMRIESRVGDVARLLADGACDDEEARRAGLAAYEQAFPFSAAERRLLPVFDHSSSLLGGLNWLSWIFLERRSIDLDAAAQRMAWHVERLAHFECSNRLWLVGR